MELNDCTIYLSLKISIGVTNAINLLRDVFWIESLGKDKY